MKNSAKRKPFEYKHIINQNEFDKESNKVNSHYHNYFEIYFFLGDRMTYFIEDKAIRLVKNDLLFVPPNTYHKSTYYENTNQERIVLNFSKEDITSLISFDIEKEIDGIFLNSLLRTDAVELKEKIKYKIQNIIQLELNNETELLRAKIMVIEFLLYIYENLNGFSEENLGDAISQTDKIIYEVVRYINKRYMEKITLMELAEKHYISKYHLCRSFKKMLGMSIITFINMKRLAEVELLLKKNKKVSEAALTVGFNSQAFFVDLFKKNYGMTPSEYKKTHLKLKR